MLAIDLEYLGQRRAICCYVDLDGEWLIDPGPEVTHKRLVEALPPDWQPRRIMLTHIHFDHAGATGRLLERWPAAEVWVHERGARHLVDPSRLLASALRIYGDDFARLFGEVVAVPAERVTALSGDEAIDGWRVAYTPGHASHHVSYLREQDGAAFAGDVAGVRIDNGPVLPPSPPPDIDREAWLDSIDVLAAWSPTCLNIAHFGSWTDVEAHLEGLREALDHWSELATRLDEPDFVDAVNHTVAERSSDEARRSYEVANPPHMLWAGWHRYWSKREQQLA